jgi:hypothetical protein
MKLHYDPGVDITSADVALSEVVKPRQRRDLLELLFTPGALALDGPDVMTGAWR